MTGTEFNLDPYIAPWPCIYTGNPSNPGGGRGYTWWYDPTTTETIGPGQSLTYTFTGTQPKCYSNKDNCNVSFNFGIDQNASGNDVKIDIKLNTQDINTPSYHSKIVGHDTRLIVDLAPNSFYNDNGSNTLVIYNNDSSRTVSIGSFRIDRIYQVYNLLNSCQGTSIANAQPIETAPSAQPLTTVNLDSTRNDYPCILPYGGCYSFTKWTYPYSNITIGPGNYYSFSFTCDTPNYINKVHCLACFDHVGIDSNASGNDVPYGLTLNGTTIRTDYHSKISGHDIWPGIDLAQYSGYNDTGNNVIGIQNNDSARTISFAGFNIYRMYQVKCLGT